MRADVGKGASRRLRRAGRVPAILYGAGRDPVSLTVDHNYLLRAIEDEAFRSSVLELVVDNDKRQKVVLRDLQRHPFKPLLTHVDFFRVSAGQALRIDVPLHFVNEEKSPAGRQSGVVISHQITEVEIAATPENLPEYLEVDLSALEPGDSIMLSQIVLPEGVTIPMLEVSEDNDASVVTAIFIRESQGTGELAAAADAAADVAPEVETVAEAEESEDDADVGDAEGDGEADSGDAESRKED
ncbi:MAG: 50S ribosomal protein L25/general stress protein Ctc [Wenzhouxiangella sp.]|nr:MAG: 50S ribosomal protein L25/general stress protein Ctc [Wenzhouxiangella sp.]